ncbi:hypothetical protein DYI21_08430 [Thalassospira tepidiphila]|nr:hypothetical protein [Thalassospira tepidiphila]
MLLIFHRRFLIIDSGQVEGGLGRHPNELNERRLISQLKHDDGISDICRSSAVRSGPDKFKLSHKRKRMWQQ